MRSTGAGVLVAILVLVGGCSAKDSGTTPNSGSGKTTTSAKKTVAVVYEATGQGTAQLIAYYDPTTGKEASQDLVTLPWRKETTAAAGDYVTMRVVPLSDDNPDTEEMATCRITVDGKDESTDSHDTLAMCNTTL